jgi:hypothetical protein
MIDLSKPSLGFVLLFLFFSFIFISNTYKLWFRTDQYYQDIYNSLTSESSFVPMKDFFRKRMENKQRWVLWQKLFSAVGIAAVLAADILIVRAYLQ